jgi:hypothetical protein
VQAVTASGPGLGMTSRHELEDVHCISIVFLGDRRRGLILDTSFEIVVCSRQSCASVYNCLNGSCSVISFQLICASISYLSCVFIMISAMHMVLDIVMQKEDLKC